MLPSEGVEPEGGVVVSGVVGGFVGGVVVPSVGAGGSEGGEGATSVKSAQLSVRRQMARTAYSQDNSKVNHPLNTVKNVELVWQSELTRSK